MDEWLLVMAETRRRSKDWFRSQYPDARVRFIYHGDAADDCDCFVDNPQNLVIEFDQKEQLGRVCFGCRKTSLINQGDGVCWNLKRMRCRECSEWIPFAVVRKDDQGREYAICEDCDRPVIDGGGHPNNECARRSASEDTLVFPRVCGAGHAGLRLA